MALLEDQNQIDYFYENLNKFSSFTELLTDFVKRLNAL